MIGNQLAQNVAFLWAPHRRQHAGDGGAKNAHRDSGCGNESFRGLRFAHERAACQNSAAALRDASL